MPEQNDVLRRKKAHRIAFEYLERQIAKMPAFASSEKYWAQAWAEAEELTCSGDDLLRELIAAEYSELERLWKLERADNP